MTDQRKGGWLPGVKGSRLLLRLPVAAGTLVLLLAYPFSRLRPSGDGGRLDSAARRLGGLAGRRTEGVSRGRVLCYLAFRLVPEIVAVLAMALLVVGAVLAGIVVVALFRGTLGTGEFLLQVLIGAVLLVLDLQLLVSSARLDDWLARVVLEPSEREQNLERRVDELALSRSEVILAVDGERRRIERDLHDGLQQRLISVGMLLGQARRTDSDRRRDELLGAAHEGAQQAIAELREVAWRVYPSALEEAGLAEVLPMVAQRAGIDTRVELRLDERLPRDVETVLYYVASEAMANVAKHAGAQQARIELDRSATMVVMTITDDGVGGADPDAPGLQGLARRVEAADGRLKIASPTGGPTTLTAEVPCDS